ncbi:tyrosine-protein phosphatase [Aestuariibius sp. 2305UL40-4]|uniref:tyrosine-protein phosphatase n=1 Tax=Aestuariibius violaceus TaxID=3234132 RepID=UPI0034924FBB
MLLLAGRWRRLYIARVMSRAPYPPYLPRKAVESYRSLRRRMRKMSAEEYATPEGKRLAAWHDNLFDQKYLRHHWTNFFQVAPGVYRSNHPTPARIAQYKELGIKTILNLRGREKRGHYHEERAACAAAGIEMVDARLYARKPARQEELLTVIHHLRTLPKPFLLHCKSGADRAGFASALYLMAVEGRPVEEARRQLGLRYIHIRQTKTGILDHILDLYAAREGEMGIEEWIRTEYDRDAIQASFDALPWWKR